MWRGMCITIVVPFWFWKFDFVNLRGNVSNFRISLDAPQPSRFGYFSLVSIFTYHLIIWYIVPFWFCKFGSCEFKDKNRSLWERINAFHDLPWHASIATISLDLAISPLCHFSLGINSLLEGSNGILLNALKWLCTPGLGEDDYAAMQIKDIPNTWPDHLDAAVKSLSDLILTKQTAPWPPHCLALYRQTRRYYPANCRGSGHPFRLHWTTTPRQLLSNCWSCCKMQKYIQH